jgi:hypothetical protein
MRRPSPSLVISIIALVVATAGTATAAGVLIKNSSQVKAGAISGSDIKKNGITTAQLSKGLLALINTSGPVATEAVRKTGPTVKNGGQALVVAMPNVPAGSYLFMAKMTMSPEIQDLGLGEILRQPKTGGGHCVLDAGGDVDDGRQAILSPESQTPSTLNMQLTRTLGKPSDVVLNCDANIGWHGNDASIIAIKLASTSRTDTADAIAPVAP